MFTSATSIESSTTVPNASRCLSAESARARMIHDVRVALRRSGHAELRGVEIDIADESVLISGRVPSFYLKQLSQELARNAAPGHSIKNELVVQSRAR